MAIPNLFRGDTWTGTATLRTLDPVDPTKMNNYVIPTGATIQMNFPGTTASVEITSGAGEVTIINPTTGAIAWTVPYSKTDPTVPNPPAVGQKLAVDVIVTDVAGNPTTFEAMKVINILDRANPS
jgi:hypothetical protein